LIDDVQLVGFLLCLRSCGEGREDGFACRCREFVARFFVDLRTDPAMIASVDCTHVSMLSPLSRSFTMPLPGSLGLNCLMRTR
jgi:hypothetical protein